MHIYLLRGEEFREMVCVNDVFKCVPHPYPLQSQLTLRFVGFSFNLTMSVGLLCRIRFRFGGRELGYALSFDHDLDMFVASLGLVETSIEAVVKEDGMSWLAVATNSRSNTGRFFTRRRFGCGRLGSRGEVIRSS